MITDNDETMRVLTKQTNGKVPDSLVDSSLKGEPHEQESKNPDRRKLGIR